MSTQNVVGWFELYVSDMERAKKFYETVFAVSLEKMPMPEGMEGDMEMWAFPADMEAGNYGAPGALVRMEGVPGFGPGPGGTVVYFSSQDCAVEAGRVADAGGKVLQEKFDIGDYGFTAMIEDTEGNTIGIHSQS